MELPSDHPFGELQVTAGYLAGVISKYIDVEKDLPKILEEIRGFRDAAVKSDPALSKDALAIVDGFYGTLAVTFI